MLALPVLVTGGSGYVGRNLIRALAARGTKIKALARSDETAALIERLGAIPIAGDLDDIKALRKAASDCAVVFHAAAYVGDWGPAELFERVNVQGTRHVLSAAKAEGVRRLVHVSTEAVLADGKPIISADEDRPIPNSVLPGYPRSKAMAEREVRTASSGSFETVVIRPRFIWGRDDTTLLPQLEQAVLTGRFAWISQGHYLTSTCHIVNACHGALLAAESGKPGAVYFLTDGDPIEARAFLSALLATRGLNPGSRSVPRTLAKWGAAAAETLYSIFESETAPPVTRFAVGLLGQEVTVRDDLARREIGYAPIMTREEGLEELKTGRWKGTQ